MQNAKCKTQSAEWKVQNAKCKAQSGKCKVKSYKLKVFECEAYHPCLRSKRVMPSGSISHLQIYRICEINISRLHSRHIAFG